MKHQQISIIDQALYLLSHREHSKKELVNKLSAKGNAQEEINSIILRLEDMNYLNDARFAEIFVRSRISKPLGKNRILQELIQNGIGSEEAKQTIADANADWFELAKQLKERRFGEETCTDYKEKAKQSRYLQYRGFDFDQIKYALSPEDND